MPYDFHTVLCVTLPPMKFQPRKSRAVLSSTVTNDFRNLVCALVLRRHPCSWDRTGECRLGHLVKAISTRSDRASLDMLSASCLAFQLAFPILHSRPFRWIRNFVKRESKACESLRNLMCSVCLPQRFPMCVPSSMNHIDGRIGIVSPTFCPIPHSGWPLFSGGAKASRLPRRQFEGVAHLILVLMNSCRAKANLLETDELDELRN
jgi:hypothetical protein